MQKQLLQAPFHAIRFRNLGELLCLNETLALGTQQRVKIRFLEPES